MERFILIPVNRQIPGAPEFSCVHSIPPVMIKISKLFVLLIKKSIDIIHTLLLKVTKISHPKLKLFNLIIFIPRWLIMDVLLKVFFGA